MKDLFTPLTRDERQEESLKAWLHNKGKGCVEGCTGYGKTRIGLNAIETVRKRYPTLSVIVVVPTDVLKNQWTKLLDERGLGLNCRVMIINTASKTMEKCDLLILDEILDNLDDVGSNKIIDLLSSELNDVSSVFVISHRNDFTIPCDNEINVIKGADKISIIL